MAAKKCLICNHSLSGRRDAKTCSARCRKRLQLVRLSFAGSSAKRQLAKAAPVLVIGLFSLLSLFISLWPSQAANAATSSNLNFQARLLTSAGQVVPDGNYHIEFKIYDSVSSGASGQGVCSLNSSTDDCWWLETRTGGNLVRVVNGYFSVNLGSVTAFGASIPWDQPLWLTMNIGGTGGSPSWDGEMLASGNRMQLTGVPYAFRAGSLAKNNGTQTGTLSFNTVANSPVITLPDATGTICLQNAAACGFAPGTNASYIQNGTSLQTNANFNIQSAAAGSIGGLITGAASQSADIFQVKADSVANSLFLVGSTGATTFRNSTNSLTAFQIQNAAGAQLVNVDSTNSNITLLGNNSGEIQSWSTNNPALSSARKTHGLAIHNGYAYIVGGMDGADAYQNNLYYAKVNANGSIGSWTLESDTLPAVRASAGTVVVNGYLYVVGGRDSSVAQDEVYYSKLNADGSTSAWQTNGVNLPAVRNGAAVTSANGYIYVISGSSGTGNGNGQTSVYYGKVSADGSIGSWVTETALSAANVRTWAKAVAANGYIYYMGGNDTATVQDDLFYAPIDAATGDVGSWSTETDLMPAARADGGVGVANGYIYWLGGFGTAEEDEVYYVALNGDGTTGAWTQSANSLPAVRDGPGSAIANGYIYVTGGATTLGAAQTSIYYTSVSRLKIGGAVDLVGLSGENLAYGGSGGELTAGNTNIIGALNVQGATTLGGSLSVRSSLVANEDALFKNTTNSTTAFQIQNATGGSLFQIDTTNSNITINGNNSGIVQAWQTGNSTGLSGRDAYASVIANGYIYIIGGESSGASGTSTVQYAQINANGNVGNWSTTTSIPANRSGASAAVANGYIYVTAGSVDLSDAGTTDTVYYGKINKDGTISSWTTSANPINVSGSKRRYFHTSVAYNGYLYVLGGRDEGANSHNNVYYSKLNADGSNGTWAATNVTALGRGHSSVVANGYVYSMARGSTTVDYAKLNADGTTSTWNTTTALPATRFLGGGIGVANGYIYYAGGENGSGTRYANTYFAPLNANGTIGTWSCQGSAGDCTGTTPVNSTALPATISGTTNTNMMHNGYLYVIGGWNGSVQSTVYYSSTARVQLNGSLDLVGNSGENLSEGRSGGALTAGNTNIIGTLNVQDNTSIWGSISVAGEVAGRGSALFQNSANSTKAFQVQNASGTSLLTADTSNLKLTVGGDIVASAAATATTGTTTGTGTNTTTLTLTTDPFSVGDVVLIDNAGQDYYTRITVDPGTNSYTVSPAVTFETSRTVTKYTIQNLGATATDYTTLTNRFFQGYFLGGIVVGTTSTTLSDGLLSSTGTLNFNATDYNFKRSADSATAFQVQNAAGAQILSVDTVAGNASIGSSTTDATARLFVLDSYNQASDPTGVAGAMYYNTNLNKFRCFQNSAWTDCTSSGSSATLQNAYDNSTSPATITTSSGTKDVIIKSGSGFNSAGVFQVQNALGSVALGVDTTPLNTLITNGSAEGTSITEWASKQNATVTRDTTEQYIGSASIKTVLGGSPAANDGVKYTPNPVLAATTYSLSFSIKQTAGTAFGTNLAVGWNNGTDANCTLSPTLTAQPVPTTGWARYSCTFTGSTGGTDHLYWKQTDAPGSARTFFIDAVQVETGTTATAFKETGLSFNGVIASPVSFKNQSNSTTAFNIQNAAGVSLFTADTQNGLIIIGPASTTPTLLVLGTKTNSGDPTCTSGAIYYNSNSSKVRVCENSVWKSISNSTDAARVTRTFGSGAQSITNNTATNIAFDDESATFNGYDTNNFHDNATNNHRLTAPVAGKYEVFANITFAANATGYRRATILCGGAADTIAEQIVHTNSATETTTINLKTTLSLSATDYCYVEVQQTSGGNLNVNRTVMSSPTFGMTRLQD